MEKTIAVLCMSTGTEFSVPVIYNKHVIHYYDMVLTIAFICKKNNTIGDVIGVFVLSSTSSFPGAP